MTEMVDWIPDNIWADIVEHVPIPSVDLVVSCDNGVLLAKRRNEPAKDEWFVPGGRIRKGEEIEAAVHRIAQHELGVEVDIVDSLGTYDHLYDTADVSNANGKHYVAHGYLVTSESESFDLDDQHRDAKVFHPEAFSELHPYVREYLIDAGLHYSNRGTV